MVEIVLSFFFKGPHLQLTIVNGPETFEPHGLFVRGLAYFAAMTKEERSLVLTKIDQKIQRTQRNIEEYKELTQPIAPENAIGRLSRMEAINSKSVAEAALREAEATLKNLQHMKAHIDDPDFGLCSKCKQEIPVQRLIVRPSSRFCVKCAK